MKKKDILPLNSKKFREEMEEKRVELLKEKKNPKAYKFCNNSMIALSNVINGALFLAIGMTIINLACLAYPTASQKDIDRFCEKYNIDTSYANLKIHKPLDLYRASASYIKPIKLNIKIDLSDEEKQILEDSVKELNSVFDVINPNYQFVIDYTPDILDLIDPHYIDVQYLDKQFESFANIKGGYMVNAGYLNLGGYNFIAGELHIRKGEIQQNFILHELMHHLGFGEAYVQGAFGTVAGYVTETPTIMAGKDDIMHLTKNDVALLAAKYGDYTTTEKENALVEYVMNYEQNQLWYQENQEPEL